MIVFPDSLCPSVDFWPSCSISTGCVVPFLTHRQRVISQGKILRNTPSRIELGLWRGQTVRYIHSPTELSWSRPWRRQTVRYIHSPTELSWPGPRRGQTVRYIHSPTELSWPMPRRGQTLRYIHSSTHFVMFWWFHWSLYTRWLVEPTIVVEGQWYYPSPPALTIQLCHQAYGQTWLVTKRIGRPGLCKSPSSQTDLTFLVHYLLRFIL